MLMSQQLQEKFDEMIFNEFIQPKQIKINQKSRLFIDAEIYILILIQFLIQQFLFASQNKCIKKCVSAEVILKKIFNVGSFFARIDKSQNLELKSPSINFKLQFFQVQIRNISMPRALIIVDPQNDFCQGGPLGVKDSHLIFPFINSLREEYGFTKTFISLDWHPDNHISFAQTHNQQPFTLKQIKGNKQMLWPKHCVQNSDGALLSKLLRIDQNDQYIKKGLKQDQQQYSAFGTQNNPTGLDKLLKQANIKQVVIVGLALDYCVGNTALDAKKAGFEVTVIEQCTKSVSEETKGPMLTKLKERNINYANYKQFFNQINTEKQ